MNPVKITFDERVSLWDDATRQDEHGTLYRDDVAPGAAWWMKNDAGVTGLLLFSCPCGCKAVVHVPVLPGFGSGHWQWNGSLEAPTLKPSILRTAGCRWHGYLTEGEFRTC